MGTSGNMEAREGGKEERSALKFRGLLRFLKWVREYDQSGPRPMRGGSLGCVRGKDYLEVDSEELIDFWRKRIEVRREYRTSLSKSLRTPRLWKGDHWVA